MKDILFKTDEFVFSYRVAGICIQDNKVLLQKPIHEDAFAFPGGHVSLGETNAQTLTREFEEEIGEHIEVKALKWIGEIFFPWGNKSCHQICLFYEVMLSEQPGIPMHGSFIGIEQMDGKEFELEFHWIALDKLNTIKLYPLISTTLITKKEEGIQYFIDKHSEGIEDSSIE